MYAVRTHIEQSVKDKTESEMIGKENANKISLGEAFQENSPFENQSKSATLYGIWMPFYAYNRGGSIARHQLRLIDLTDRDRKSGLWKKREKNG